MAQFLADEHVDPRICADLRLVGHEVETVRGYSASKTGDGWPDEQVLKFAIDKKLAIITSNECDFCRLAKTYTWHYGIILVNPDHPPDQVAKRIDAAARSQSSLRSTIIKLTASPPTRKQKPRGIRKM
jgi:hypothetical protein